jgi:hypothetical protein
MITLCREMDYLTKSKHSTNMFFDHLKTFINIIHETRKDNKELDLKPLRDMFLKITVFGYKQRKLGDNAIFWIASSKIYRRLKKLLKAINNFYLSTDKEEKKS